MAQSSDTRAEGLENLQAVWSVSRETKAQLERYVALLLRWTGKINLISSRSAGEVWTRHVLDSAQLMSHLPPVPEGRLRHILDLGSGGGFPGLVIAILGAGRVQLVEADQRKATFLREAIRVCGLGDRVTVLSERIEALAGDPRIERPVDLVTARALAPLDRLLGYVETIAGPGTPCLFLKGQAVEEELTLAGKAWKMRTRRIQSRSDPDGVILEVEDFSRHDTES